MERKDLAKEYAKERLSERKSGNEISFEDKAIFTAEDIENAFNAGRKSVVDNIPGLYFEEDSCGYIAAVRRCLMIDVISDEELEKGLEVKFVPFLNKVRNDAVRNDEMFPQECGYADGYVAVPPHHPLWGMHYDRVNEIVSVHGGLTYSRAYNEKLVSDAILLSEDEVPVDSWIFGFDTIHYGDNLENCSEAFCKAETIKLVEQFKKIKL